MYIIMDYILLAFLGLFHKKKEMSSLKCPLPNKLE